MVKILKGRRGKHFFMIDTQQIANCDTVKDCIDLFHRTGIFVRSSFDGRIKRMFFGFLSYYSYRGLFWVKLFRIGLQIKNTQKQRLDFFEAYPPKRGFRIGKYHIRKFKYISKK